MNGVHDVGGMQGMGPIHPEKNEPVFHQTWEGRVLAINNSLSAFGKWSIDERRHQVELIPPLEQMSLSYYEKWMRRNIELAEKYGMLTAAEVESGHAEPGSAKATPALTLETLPKILRGTNYMRPDAPAKARFKTGQHVLAKNINPAGHTRLPRYARGKKGTVHHVHGIFVFPDTNAHRLGEKPQYLYSVKFSGRELWGEGAPARDFVYLDLWDDYLDRA